MKYKYLTNENTQGNIWTRERWSKRAIQGSTLRNFRSRKGICTKC
jgi:hypothetical protein